MKPPLKRILLYFLLALVIALISVFLVGTEKAYGSPLIEEETKTELGIEIPKAKVEVVEDKKEELTEIQHTIAVVAEEKQVVERTLEDTRSEIEKMRAEIAEIRRIKALRIVPESAYSSSAAGNLYALGNCTWYAKSRRPDLPNNLGNANTWYINAEAEGYKVGAMAKTGAVGVSTRGYWGHVVYVEKWLGDGQVLISEMNYNGLYSTRTNIVAESDFMYIYEMNMPEITPEIVQKPIEVVGKVPEIIDKLLP